MNQSNKLYLGAAGACVLACFVAGVVLSSRPKPKPVPLASKTPSFSATGKPSVTESRRTATPLPAPVGDLPPPVNKPSGLNFWVYQDNAPLFGGQGLNQPELRRLPFATPLTLLKEEDDWAEVQVVLSGEVGWIRRNQILDKPPPEAKGARAEDALPVLMSFFAALNRRDYGPAYDQLSFEFKRALPFRTFSQGYRGLERVDMRVIRVATLSPTSRVFYLEMLCMEKPKAKAYQAEYTLVLEKDVWRIAQADLTEMPLNKVAPFPASGSNPTQPAFPDPTSTPGESDDPFPE
jgi:hypothetical protein